MSDMFPRTRYLRPGYRPEQVDAYFAAAREIYDAGELDEMDSEGVRTVAFDIVRRGYRPESVDAALDRLETAFLHRRRADYVAEHGRRAWMEVAAQLATSLYPRLLRPSGQRFAPAHGQGYDVAEVDAVMDRLSAYFDDDVRLTAAEVRSQTFNRARGARAYDEASVDRYLARVVEVLLSVE